MTISAKQMTTMKYGLRIEKPDIYSTIRCEHALEYEFYS